MRHWLSNPSSRLLTTAMAVFLADYGTKQWARLTLPVGASVPVIPGWLHWTHAQNTGAAFSLLAQNNSLITAIVIGFLLVLGVIVMLVPQSYQHHPWGVGAVLGGALGNLRDRLILGRVTDFIDVKIIHYPIFNIADSAICIALLWMCWCYVFKRHPAQG